MKNICFICEGLEEQKYIEKLSKLNVWSNKYKITIKNAKGIGNISAKYQYEFQNSTYDLIIIFCDTELHPYAMFETMIKKILVNFHNTFIGDLCNIIFANPCTLQIVLSHFDKVNLNTNEKAENAKLIFKFTNIKNYDGNQKKIDQLMNKLSKENYKIMKKNMLNLRSNYKFKPSSNFLELLNNLENNDAKWIDKIKEKLNY